MNGEVKHKFLGMVAIAGALLGTACGSEGDETSTMEGTSATGDTVATAAETTPTEAASEGSSSEGGSSSTGEADTDTTGAAEVPEIAGMYTDAYGTMHVISAAAWEMGMDVFSVLTVDNEGDHLTAQNGAANGFFPGLYSRFDWHVEAEDVFYCQIAYDAADEAAAEATPGADGANLMTGCNGFSWTSLTP